LPTPNLREGKTFQIFSTMQTDEQYGMAMLNDALMELVQKVFSNRATFI